VATTTLLAEVRRQPLVVEEVLAAVADPAAGGNAVFVGTVREEDGGRPVVSLEYSAHPSATEVLRALVTAASGRPGVLRAAVLHRVGTLAVGDVAVVAAVSAAHRGPALDACGELVEAVKHELPVWKHQRFADGTEEWVGSC